MLRIVEIFTRMILFPGIWIFICLNIPGIREDALSFANKIFLRNRKTNIKKQRHYYKKLA